MKLTLSTGDTVPLWADERGWHIRNPSDEVRWTLEADVVEGEQVMLNGSPVWLSELEYREDWDGRLKAYIEPARRFSGRAAHEVVRARTKP